MRIITSFDLVFEFFYPFFLCRFVWIAGAPDATAVHSFLRNPNVRLMSFPMAEAFTCIFPELVRLVLPQSVIDIDHVIPSNDGDTHWDYGEDIGP